MKSGERLEDAEWLLRRGFSPDKKYISKDFHINSRAFAPREKDEGKLSVDIERLTTHEHAIQDAARFRLCRIQAKVPHSIGLLGTYDPIAATSEAENGNPAHALISGFDAFDDSLPAILAKNAVVVDIP
jgi:hypothetical protein